MLKNELLKFCVDSCVEKKQGRQHSQVSYYSHIIKSKSRMIITKSSIANSNQRCITNQVLFNLVCTNNIKSIEMHLKTKKNNLKKNNLSIKISKTAETCKKVKEIIFLE